MVPAHNQETPVQNPEDRSRVNEYRNRQMENRQAFLQTHKDEQAAFEETIVRLEGVLLVVSKSRTLLERTNISDLPWLRIMARQFLNSWDLVSARRSYDAWLVIRPALEAALIMGKWMDRPKLYGDIWLNQETDKKKYNREFQGPALVSESLPDSGRIQKVLSVINRDFMHCKLSYYVRHSRRVDDGGPIVGFYFFEEDSHEEQKTALYAIMHLTRFLLQSVSRMFAVRFALLPEFDAHLAEMEGQFAERVALWAKDYPGGKPVLLEMGLWPESAFR